jgi:hypothetical protein
MQALQRSQSLFSPSEMSLQQGLLCQSKSLASLDHLHPQRCLVLTWPFQTICKVNRNHHMPKVQKSFSQLKPFKPQGKIGQTPAFASFSANHEHLKAGWSCCVHQFQTSINHSKSLHPRLFHVQISDFHANCPQPFLTC